MNLPNFVVIGAARCATTSLHKYLGAHPDVFLPEIKELNFFSNDRYYAKGLAWYGSHFEAAHTTAIGEASTSYTKAVDDSTKVVDRLCEHLGTPRLVYIVRDPIDRLVSHYIHYRHRGQRTAPVDSLASNELYEDTRWQGRYHHQLSLYRKRFPAESILVITTRELGADPTGTMDKIFRHIGVEPLAIPESVLTAVHNSSEQSTDKSPFGQKILNFYARHVEQRRIPYPLKSAVVRLAGAGALPIGKIELSSEQVADLLAFYSEDSRLLAEDYGVDIETWNTA